MFLWKNHAFQRRTDSESCKNEYAALNSYLENVIKICTCAICTCVLGKMIIVTKEQYTYNSVAMSMQGM